MRQERKQQAAALRSSAHGVNPAARVFDPSDGEAAAEAARAQLAAKPEQAARN